MQRLKAPGPYIPKQVVYVLEIERKPILAFEAVSGREAKELAREEWLRADLKRLTSNGVPLWDGVGRIQVGVALGDQLSEVTKLLRAQASSDALSIVYLVRLDQKKPQK